MSNEVWVCAGIIFIVKTFLLILREKRRVLLYHVLSECVNDKIDNKLENILFAFQKYFIFLLKIQKRERERYFIELISLNFQAAVQQHNQVWEKKFTIFKFNLFHDAISGRPYSVTLEEMCYQ